MKKKLFRKITKKCVVIYRWFTGYRKRVRMTEAELGCPLETC